MGRLLAVATLLLAALLAAAGSVQGATKILAIGDFGVGGDVEKRMGTSVKRFALPRGADALATLGDNDYTEDPAAFRQNWNASFGWAERLGLLIAGSLGNHDVRVDGGRYEFDSLGMPGRYYTRRIGNVRLFALDSNRVGTGQTRWLRRKLAGSNARWKVAVFHHPAYTCGAYRSHPDVVSRWVPLFERYGIDLVLSGHDHNYQRFAPRRGVTYAVHGGGGQRLYGVQQCPSSYPRRVVGKRIHGWVYLRADADRLKVRAVGRAGRVRDAFAIYP